MKIRVLFVAHSGEISGGANRSLLGVLEQLAASGKTEASVLIPERGSPLEAALRNLKIPVYTASYHSCCTEYRKNWKDALRFAKIRLGPVLDRINARRLARSLKDRFDVVYTNERMICFGAFLARELGLPHIWHVRSFAGENRVSYAPFYPRLMDRFSSRIVLISSALYREFARSMGEEKLRLIHNGIDFSKPAPPVQSHEGFRLLLTGRIVPAKGQLEAIRALDMVIRKSGDERISLWLAGQVPSYDESGYLDVLRREISRLGLTDRVRFLGEVTDMAAVRSQVDLELVCSWCEAFGRVTVEAMGAGIPVIGTDSGGTPDLIQDGETGLLYAPGHPEQLAEKILWCVHNPARTAEMAGRSRSEARKRFSIQGTAEKICSVIEECTWENHP